MAGKGDKPRPVDREKYGANWERIFGGDGKSTVGRRQKRQQDGGSTPPTSTIGRGNKFIDSPAVQIDWSND